MVERDSWVCGCRGGISGRFLDPEKGCKSGGVCDESVSQISARKECGAIIAGDVETFMGGVCVIKGDAGDTELVSRDRR